MPDTPDEFDRLRPRFLGLAYRMLGSRADAEDVMQEAWLRWQRTEAIEQPATWLRTAVTRLCLDHLGLARVRREQYVGPWLPEPLDTGAAPADEELADAESISTAFLLLLERLSPLERAAFLLRQVFDLDYAEIAAVLGRSEAAVRQLVSRARATLARDRPRFAPDAAAHARLLGAFIAAAQGGDVAALASLLADDVRAYNDGGGKARAATRVVAGPDKVARLFVGLARKGGATLRPEPRQINGWPGLVLWEGERLDSVVGIETDGDRIHAIFVTVNPDKLGGLTARA